MSKTLVASISGIRGIVGTDLTPELVSLYAAGLGQLAVDAGKPCVVLGRDARTSGPMLSDAARAGIRSVGCDVIEVGVVPTPTVQLAVEHHNAGGGLILTASHNPIEWNALKLVGADTIFLDAATGAHLKELVDHPERLRRAGWDTIGSVETDPEANQRHIERVLSLPTIDVEAIRARQFTVGLDCVRGVGGGIIPALLEALGCTVHAIHTEMDGHFPRGPEPVPANLGDLKEVVAANGCDIGLAMDPDGDRLALTDETGRAIGEDYTLSFAVEAILAQEVGPVVVNQSTSLVVDDAARGYGVDVQRAKVGEANVARAMRDAGAIVGGEGNGGVMLAELHLGRDAPVATALVLHLMTATGQSISQLVESKPRYTIVKAKADLGADLDAVYEALRQRFNDAGTDDLDGLRLFWEDRWLHVRPSGTEPIVRMIAEAGSADAAEGLVDDARAVLGECG